MFGISRRIRNLFRPLMESFEDLMKSTADLSQSTSDLKHLRTYSPETETIIERISASQEGKFVMNSGVLSPDEIAQLSRLQLANFLANSTALFEMLGVEAFTAAIPESRKALLKKISKWQKAD